MSGFHLGLLIWGGIVQVHYIMCMHDVRCMHCVGIISGVFSFCYILIGRKDYHVFILSQHYENDMSDDTRLEHAYINADIWLDPDGKLLPTNCYMELYTAAMKQSKHLIKK